MSALSLARFALVLVAFALLLAAAGNACAQSYQYDAAGRLTTASYPSGAMIRYEYDAASNVTRVQHIPATSGLLPPDGVIDTPAANVTISAGRSVSFTGSGTDPDGAVPLAFLWDFDGAAADSTDEDPGDVVFATPGTYVVEFTVTDATGLADPTPDTVTVTVNAVSPPPGGGSGGSEESGGGGGAAFLLPLFALMVLLRRYRRALVAVTALGLAAGAHAQTTAWVQMGTPTTESLMSVWGTSATNVYAVGMQGTFLHFDGNEWSEYTEHTVPALQNLSVVGGRSATDMYVGGWQGYLWHYNGTDWAAIHLGISTAFNGIWTAGPGEPLYLMAGATGAWELEPGLDPRDPNNWLRRGFVGRFSGALEPDAVLMGVGGVADHVMMVGQSSGGRRGGVYHNFSKTHDWDSTDVIAFSNSDMFIIGELSYRLDGGDPDTFGDWTQINVMPDPLALWGTAEDNVYAIGGALGTALGGISHYDGNAENAWESQLHSNVTLRAIHGFDTGEVFVVGDLGRVYLNAEAQPEPGAANYPHAGTLTGNVNAVTGELVHEVQDFSVGEHFPITFKRYYASHLSDRLSVGGTLGRNWTHNYEWNLDMDYEGRSDLIRVTDWRGREYVFGQVDGDWRLEELYSGNVSLAEAGGTSNNFWFTDHDEQRLYLLRGDGRLLRIEDNNGNALNLTWNSGYLRSIYDDEINQIAIDYGANNLISRVYVPGSSVTPDLNLVFDYDNGVLQSVTQRLGEGDDAIDYTDTLYGYSSLTADTALLSSIDVGGTVESVAFYDEQKRVDRVALTNGGEFQFSYSGSTVTETRPDGAVRTLEHDAEGRLLRDTDGAGGVASYSYDDWGRIIAATDRAGRTTRYEYELESGMVTRVIEPGERITESIIEARNSAEGLPLYYVTRRSHTGSLTEYFDYDPLGNLTSYRQGTDVTWTFTYDESGRRLSMINPLGGQTIYEYNNRGRLHSVTEVAAEPGETDKTTTYRYDIYQRPTRVEYPDGSMRTTTWDGWRIASVEDQDGPSRYLSYTPAGQVQSVSDSDGLRVSFSYDEGGRLTSQAEGDGGSTTGAATSFDYDDLNRVTQTATATGNTNTYSHDSADRVTTRTDANGRDWDYTYRPDGKVETLAPPEGEPLSVDTTTDPRGLDVNVAQGGETASVRHDDEGRVSAIVDQQQRTTSIGRDSRGFMTNVAITAVNWAIAMARDPLGNIIELSHAAGGAWHYGYGSQGRLRTAADPLGRETRVDYDALNRIDRVVFDDGLEADIVYGSRYLAESKTWSNGYQLDLFATPEGRVVGGTGLSLGYDAHGDLVDSNGIGIAYYADNRILRTELAPGRAIEYEYDGNGFATVVRDWLGGETMIDPTDRGQPDLVTYPNGVVADYHYNGNGRLTGISYPGFGEVLLLRATNGRVESVTRNLPGPTGIEALDLRYDYNDAFEVDRFDYDGRGNLTRDDERSYTVDPAGRLLGYTVAGGMAEVERDVAGNLLGIAAPGHNRSFVYNYALGHPQAMIERDENGNDLWYYVFTPRGELLYRISADGQRQVYHFDQDGNTAFMTDDAGQLLQSYFYSPAGMLLDEEGGLDNDYTARARYGSRRLAGTRLIDSAGDVRDPAADIRHPTNAYTDLVDPDGLLTKLWQSQVGLDNWRYGTSVGERPNDGTDDWLSEWYVSPPEFRLVDGAGTGRRRGSSGQPSSEISGDFPIRASLRYQFDVPGRNRTAHPYDEEWRNVLREQKRKDKEHRQELRRSGRAPFLPRGLEGAIIQVFDALGVSTGDTPVDDDPPPPNGDTPVDDVPPPPAATVDSILKEVGSALPLT